MNVQHPTLQHHPDSADADHSDEPSDEVTSAQEDVKKPSNTTAPMQKRRRVTRACDEVSLRFCHRLPLLYLVLECITKTTRLCLSSALCTRPAKNGPSLAVV